MIDTVFPKRDWISAQASFMTQATELLAMADRLHDQIQSLSMTKPKRVALIGIGASHAAAASAAYQMRCDGLDALRFLPSELPAGLSGFDGLTVLISQSGRSAEVVALVREGLGNANIAITNYTPSPLGTICENELNLGNLSDSSVSFVSFTGSMLALALLADHWAGRDRLTFWKQQITQAFEAVERNYDQIRDIAGMLLQTSYADVVAPAPLMSAAEEAVLMLREGPRLFATAMETRQYLHGPMDAAGPGAHLVFGFTREAQLISQLSERTRHLAFVSTDGSTQVPAGVHRLVLPAGLADPMSFTFAATAIAQKLTLHAADIRGIDINEAAFQRIDTKTDCLTTL